MSGSLAQAGARALARFESLRDTLPGDITTRDAAAAAFRAQGLPDRHDEAWKYTSLRALAETTFAAPTDTAIPPALAPWAAVDMPRIVLVNGVMRADLSVLPSGITVSGSGDAVSGGAAVEAAPLVALNTMLTGDGVVLHVAAGIDAGTLALVSLTIGDHAEMPAVHPRHRVRLDANARLTLVEIMTGSGRYFANPVLELAVGDGAALSHVRLQQESTEAVSVATLFVDAGAGATYDGFTLALGAALARTEIHARLHGPEATVHLNGAQLLAGTQHADFTTVVSHDAPSCASRQTVKNVLAGRSRGVFQGKIEVARAAQKTDGYQMNQALLLSPDAEIDSKPQLEIYADDVKCSHGATVGELDAEQIFYLRSRGVAERDARTLLIRAFLAQSLADVADEQVRALLEAALESSWEKLER